MLIANELMYDEQKNLLLETFTNSASLEDPKTEADAVVDLVIKLVCLHRDLNPNDPNARESLQTEIRAKMLSFDPNDPQLTHPAKLLRLLGGSTPEEMLTYAEDLVSARLSDERQKQVSRARTTRKRDALEELIAGWLKLEPSLSPSAIVDRIRELRGGNIIVDVSEETIWYLPFPIDHPKKTKEIRIAGMAARISRIKNINR